MPSLVTTNFKYQAAQSFIQSMAGELNSLYLFIGRQTPWANEPTPDVPVETNFNYYTIWTNMMSAILVTENNMSLVIPNVQWSNTVVYSAYSDQVDMYTIPTSNSFYMMNTSNEVYKCIANNNGAISTFMPAGPGSSSSNYIQTMDDGYQWKYMLNVESIDKFLTSSWIPIPIIPPPNSFQALMANSAIPGSICAINVIYPGRTYTNNSIAYIVTITGDGTGANAYANIVNDQVQNVVMTDYGQGYTYATVGFKGGGGRAQAAFTARGTAVISPPGGHGSNASLELGAKSVMVAVETSNTESGYFTISNAFRQNGLILNPLLLGTSNIANASLIQTATYLNLGGGTGTFINGETVFQGANLNTFTGVVIDYNSTPNLLRLNNITGIPQIGNILIGESSGAQRYITSYQNPDVQPYTGLIIDFDNEQQTTRQTGQTELFQFIETFG